MNIFDSQEEDQDTILRCPECGSEYLGHSKIEIFNRSEDAEVGFHVVVEGFRSTTDPELVGNPSLRRSGLIVNLICENGGHESRLTLLQHKGQTFVELL